MDMAAWHILPRTCALCVQLPAEYEPAERTKMLLEVFGQDVDIGSMLQVRLGPVCTRCISYRPT